MSLAKHYTTYLEVRDLDGFPMLCELKLTPIGSSSIEPPGSYWMQLLRNLVSRKLTIAEQDQLDSLLKPQVEEVKF